MMLLHCNILLTSDKIQSDSGAFVFLRMSVVDSCSVIEKSEIEFVFRVVHLYVLLCSLCCSLCITAFSDGKG